VLSQSDARSIANERQNEWIETTWPAHRDLRWNFMQHY